MEEKKILTAEEEAESLAEQARIRREKLQKLVPVLNILAEFK